MPNYSSTTLIGHVGQDPLTKHFSGTSVTTFTVAVNNKYKTSGGELRDEVLWMNVATFGKTSDYVSQYIKKGNAVLVEGRLRQTKWKDRDGNEKTGVSLVAREVRGLGGRSQPSPQPNPQPRHQRETDEWGEL